MIQKISAILLTFSALLLTSRASGETLEVGVDQALQAESAPATGATLETTGPLAALTTSVGTTLDPDEPESAITFEPIVGWTFAGGRSVSLYSAIVRPFDAFENFEAPKTNLTLDQKLALLPGWKTAVGATVNALSLHRWTTDGSMVRWGLFGSVSREVLRGLTVGLTLSPFVQTNRYTQTTSGKNLDRWGLTETVTAVYVTGPVKFELGLVVGQRHNGSVWTNSYSTLESVSYQVTDDVALGLSHGLVSSLVDSSTGRYAPIRVFDGRQSEVAAFVTVQM